MPSAPAPSIALLATAAAAGALGICWLLQRLAKPSNGKDRPPPRQLKQLDESAAPALPAAAEAAAARTDSHAYLHELLQEVGSRSKAVMYVVSNKTNDQFSAANLSKYLKQRGVEVHEGGSLEEAMAVNARRLLELLERRAASAPGKQLVQALRHELLQQTVPQAELEALFPAMKEAYIQQPLDYGRNSRYGDNWRISCYIVVMDNWKPKILAHEPMVRCMTPVMNQCCEAFARWYCRLRTIPAIDVHVMNAFVTRYRPIHNEDELQRHIDGANVDGSVILALPTDDLFEGGNLRVWDGKPQQEYEYEMKAGDTIFLDNAVWHQAKPISSGTRWALVLFLRLRPPAGTTAGARTSP